MILAALDTPFAPVDAYWLMEPTLGSSYFERPQSPDREESFELIVVGRDGLPTNWLIPQIDASALNLLLQGYLMHGKILNFRFRPVGA